MDAIARTLENLDFHHPYTPYDVQEQFMKTVFTVLEAGNGQVGILESPTGTVSSNSFDHPHVLSRQPKPSRGSRSIQTVDVNEFTNVDQGKSLSLICASLTWLRHHKSSQFEASIQGAADAYKDEPSWVVDQLLRRKRQELVNRFEDREKRLEALRLKEKALEERGRKRRRIEDFHGGSRVIDEDAEWLLDDVDDRDTGSQDALSGLTKESRDVLTSLGLGNLNKPDKDEDVFEEEIKVRHSCPVVCNSEIVTIVDLLHFKNPFPTLTIHHRTPPSYFPSITSTVIRKG